MAKKPSSSTKKSLRSLFSKSEANLSDTTVAESGSLDRKPSSSSGGGADKKKFKFPGLKIKSKSEKAAPETEQVPGVEKPGLNADSSSDNVSTGTDRSSLYATAPRSKGKELSVSEIDLSSKPKRFATIHLGLRKKKKKEESVLSKSTFGIDSSGIEGQQEASSGLSQMSLTHNNTKTMSRSQPELDTAEKFDIPSPPPLAINRPEFLLPGQSEASVTVHSAPVKPQPIQNIIDEAPKAPIATIPELNLGDNLKISAKETTPNVSSYTEATAASSKVDKAISNFTMPKFDAGRNDLVDSGTIQGSNTKLEIPVREPAQPEKPLQIKTGASDLQISTTAMDKPEIDTATAINPKVANAVDDIRPTVISRSDVDAKTVAANLDNRVESFAATGNASSSGKSANLDTTITKKPVIYSSEKSTVDPIAPSLQVSQNYGDNLKATTFLSESKMADQDDAKSSIAVEEKQPAITNPFTTDPKMASTTSSSFISSLASASKPAKLDTAVTETTTIYSSEKSVVDPIASSVKVSQNDSNILKKTTLLSQSKMPDEDKVYENLYDSLFPENFTQEVISSLLNKPPKLASVSKSIETMTETVLITRFESERSSTPLSTSSPEKIEESLGAFSSASDNISSFVDETLTKDAPKAVYIRKVTTYDETSTNEAKPVVEDGRFAYSEFSTEAKYEIGSSRDTMKPSSYAEKSPPLFSRAPSQETSARVTSDTKKKAVLVKELVSEEASCSSRDSGCPTPVMEKMSTTPSSEVKPDEFEILSVTSGHTELHDGICSPAYLSVGSDDGSAMEVYYSAEEDNSDDLFTADSRETTVIEMTRDAGALEEQITNRVVVLREDAGVFANSLERAKLTERNDNGMFEERVMKAENESKVEPLAAPVERVKEFEVVPPFTGELGRKEGQGVSRFELKSASLVDKSAENKLPEFASISKSVLETPSSSSSNKWQSTPKFAEEAERVLPAIAKKESMLAEEISDAGGNNGPAVSVREVDSVTERAGRSEAEQVAIAEQGQRSSATVLQITEETDARRDQGPHQDLRQGSLPSSLTPPIEQKFPDPDADSMSSGYSSLSTTLSLKTSAPSQSEDARYRFRKVSLVSDGEGDAADLNDVTTTTTITTVTSNGTDTDYKWRNRFEGVRQFRPLLDTYKSSEYSLRSTTDDTAASLPEATDYSSISAKTESSSSISLSLSDRLDDTDGRVSRRGFAESGEGLSTAPALEPREGEADGVRSLHDSSTAAQQEEDSAFSGVFKATLVDLVPDSPAPRQVDGPASPPGTPEETDDSPSQFDMDNLVDTLKNMGPSMRMRSLSARGAQPSLLTSSLPPIVEDAPGSIMLNNNNRSEVDGLNGNIYSLPPDIGLKKSSLRDMRSPLELMKQSLQDQQIGSRTLPMPLRASATNSIVMRSSTESSSPEDLPSPVLMNGSTGSSRLDNSLIFSSLRSSSVDQTSENGVKTHRSLFRASSLPDIGHSNDRMSLPPREGGENEPAGTRFERFSFLLNPTASSSGGSLTGGEDYASRISRAPPLSIGSPSSGNSPTLMLSPTGSLELNRPFATTMADSSPIRVGPPLLQRSFSGDSGVGLQQGVQVFQNFQNHFQPQEPEPERNLLSKYRAFPDAYLTKEKEHGKLNPRPGKMYIFDQPGMTGQRTEIRSDVADATSWELEETISIRVVRGGWVLYEKPDFKGEKIALDEGDIELTNPFGPMEDELQNGQMNGQRSVAQANGVQTNGEQNGDTSETATEETPTRRFIIGSIRRAVRDYSVPEISLFPEQNAEGKKVVFRDSSEDARIFGFPIKANSIVINAGLWLVYAQPFFQGVPRVLEVGGYTNPEAWGVEQPYVASLHPLKIGEPRVENMSEPKMVVFEKPYFCGKSRTITTNSRDFMTRVDRQQQAFMHNVGSLKVQGGMWVGYEKEGFRGHQYLLEEGDYQDWRVWGGVDSELRSVRVIRAEMAEPLMVMFEEPEEEQEEGDGNTFEVTEAIPDVELFDYKTCTRSIQVVSGAWVAYSHVDFSGSQYILEKGFYNNYADWGALDSRICSVQPILAVPKDNTKNRSQVTLYTEPGFQGQCMTVDRNQEALSDKLLPKSCRVTGGSWVLFENKQFQGNMYVLSEGDYPNLNSMGCPSSCFLRSVKAVPMSLSVPSISLFGLECLEGREITTETEIFSLVEEGYNNHILSLRVNSGSWVICEHSNYRGRQFLLEPIEITNWPKFSSMPTIGSMYPVRQKRSVFRVKNKELGHYLSVQGGVEEMKSGRVVVSPEVEPMSDVWYYQDGLVKNKLSPSMCLQVMGNVEPAAKVVLWAETRQPIQSWTAHMRGLITSLTFPGMVLDVKGGKTYDRSHVVIMPEDEDRPSQQWEIELL